MDTIDEKKGRTVNRRLAPKLPRETQFSLANPSRGNNKPQTL